MSKGWAVDLSDNFFVIMWAFLAGSEKAPAKMNWSALVSFKNNAENVLLVKEKL